MRSSFAFGYFKTRRRIVAVNNISQFCLILLFIINEKFGSCCVFRLFLLILFVVAFLVKTRVYILERVSICPFEFKHVLWIHGRYRVPVYDRLDHLLLLVQLFQRRRNSLKHRIVSLLYKS